MVPELARLGPLGLGTHDFFLALGTAAAGTVFWWEARRRLLGDVRLVVAYLGVAFVAGLAFVGPGSPPLVWLSRAAYQD